MSEKYIVLSSEYGSGARLIAKKLSEQLGIKFYGEEDLLIEAANLSGIDINILRNYEENLVERVHGGNLNGNGAPDELPVDMPLILYQALSSAITKVMEEGPCILMERGADLVLRDKVDFLNVFVYSTNMENKIERTVRVGGIPEEGAVNHIQEQNLIRKIYHNSFSTIEWAKMSEYDLCLNSDSLGFERCAEAIKAVL
jgi:cytidylate kinase